MDKELMKRIGLIAVVSLLVVIVYDNAKDYYNMSKTETPKLTA